MSGRSLVQALYRVHTFDGKAYEYDTLLSLVVAELLQYLGRSHNEGVLHVTAHNSKTPVAFIYDDTPTSSMVSHSDILLALESDSLSDLRGIYMEWPLSLEAPFRAPNQESLQTPNQDPLQPPCQLPLHLSSFDPKYRFIVRKLQSLVEFIQEIHALSDLKLIMLLSSSFQHASRHLEPLYSHTIHRPHPDQFHCDNATMATIYRYFSAEISSDVSLDSNLEPEYHHFAELLVALLKRFLNIQSLTLSDFATIELTVNKFQEFFLAGNSTDDPPLLPSRFGEINQKMILTSNFLHQNSKGLDTDPYLPSTNSIDLSSAPTTAHTNFKPSYLASTSPLLGHDLPTTTSSALLGHDPSNTTSISALLGHDPSNTSPTTFLADLNPSNTNPTSFLADLNPYNATSTDISPTTLSRPAIDRPSLIATLRELALEFAKHDPSFDLRFAKVFEIYSGLYYSDWHRYATIRDREFLDEMNYYIQFLAEDASVHDDDKDLEALSIRNFFDLHLLLLSKEDSSCTILMRSSLFLYERDAKTRACAFMLWNDQSRKVRALDSNFLAQKYTMAEKRLKSIFFSNWLHQLTRIQDIEAAVEAECALSTAQFAWDKWLAKLHLIQRFKSAKVNRIKKRAFCNWSNLAAAANKNTLVAQNFYQHLLLRQTWDLLQSRHSHLRQLAMDAERFYSSIQDASRFHVLKKVWISWYRKMDGQYDTHSVLEKRSGIEAPLAHVVSAAAPPRRSERGLAHKLFLLSEMERILILRQFHGKWSKSVFLVNAESRFVRQRNHRTKQFIFLSTWQKKTVELQLSRELLADREVAMLRRIFRDWSVHSKSIAAARAFYSKQLAQTFFRRWTLRVRENSWLSRDTDRPLLAATFKQWLLAHRRRNFDLATQKKIKRATFKSWHSELLRHRDFEESATKYQNECAERAIFSKWTASLARVRQSIRSADQLLKQKIFHRLSDKLAAITVATEMASAHDQENKWVDRFDTLVCLRIWSKSCLERKQHKLDDLALAFQINVSIPFTKRQTLVVWKNKLYESRFRLERLGKLSEIYATASTYPILRVWYERVQHIHELERSSILLSRSLLLKKALILWYSNRSRLLDLENKCMELLDSHQIRACSVILKGWSRRTTNIRTRNRQSYVAFCERKNLASMRIFFLLWRHQLDQRSHLRQSRPSHAALDADSDTAADADEDSSITDSSPLANKSSASRLSTSTFLSTPVKEHVSPTRYATPRVLPNSPSRLTQSTQRLRMERILAQKQHLSSARTSPHRSDLRLAPNSVVRESKTMARSPSPPIAGMPPLIGEDTNNRFISLSPPHPRRSQVGANMGIPPAAPKFASARPSKEKDTATNTTLNTPTAGRLVKPISSLGEENAIATAKRMKKITPMVMPPFEEEDQLRYSPASKIRERLLAQSDL